MWNSLLSRSFDKWSSTYDVDIAKSFARRGINYQNIWDHIQSELAVNSGAHLLEIGVGTGSLGRCTNGYDIVGLDISKGMLNQARKVGAYRTLIHSSADRLPFLDNTFDGVFTAFMFHSEKNPLRLLKECRRVLKHGGKIVLVDLFPRGRSTKKFHWLWSNIHSFRYENFAPSFYKPIERQGDIVSKIFTRVTYRYIDVFDNVYGTSLGEMSHGLIAGECS